MSESLPEDAPEFEPVVDGFLSIADPLLHELCLLLICKALRTFDTPGVLSNIAIIRFNPFVWLKVAL